MAPRSENQIIIDSMPIVYSIVKKLNCAGPGYDDAVQIGRVSVLTAIRTHDQSKGGTLTTWIYHQVHGAIRDWMDSETLRRAGHGYTGQEGIGNDSSDWAPRKNTREEEQTDTGPHDDLESATLSMKVQAKIKSLPPEFQSLAESLMSGEQQRDYAARTGINASTHHRRRVRLAEFFREIKDELDE